LPPFNPATFCGISRAAARIRIDAALADELQLRQPLEQRRADLRALADQHQRLDVAQSRRERVAVLHMVVKDAYVVLRQLAEDAERPHRVVVVVEDRDLHGWNRR
jgi:hypothetical protein